MVMFERYRKDRALELLRQTTRRLMSTLGEANAQSIAIKLIDQYERLDVKQRCRYFDFLASDFNPEPAEVKTAAERYASDSSAANLMALLQVVESPRQELLRRINRAPNGTQSIVKMREAMLPYRTWTQSIWAQVVNNVTGTNCKSCLQYVPWDFWWRFTDSNRGPVDYD